MTEETVTGRAIRLIQEEAAAKERERCAQIAEHLNGWGSALLGDERAAELAAHIAKVIRDQ